MNIRSLRILFAGIIISFAIMPMPKVLAEGHNRQINAAEYHKVASLLEPEIKREDILKIEVQYEDRYSTTYFIMTKDGQKIWQVISNVLLDQLPRYAHYVCLAAIRNKLMCEIVYLAGSAIVKIIAINPVVKFWQSRLSGDKGIASISDNYATASIKATTLEEAFDGQNAFKASAQETDFPWESAKVIQFDDNTERMDGGSYDSSESAPPDNGGMNYGKRLGGGAYDMNMYFFRIIIENLTERLYSSSNAFLAEPAHVDIIRINNILLEFKTALGGRAANLYTRSDIDSETEAFLRTKIRIPDNAMITGVLDDTAWRLIYPKFTDALVFAHNGLYFMYNGKEKGFIPWKRLKNSKITWDDYHVIITYVKSVEATTWERIKTGKTNIDKEFVLELEVSDSGLFPVEVAKLIRDIAYYDDGRG
ncbi:MAG: hypothetical protein H6557_17760 [Lewinellaceae bacterium]|nr:hypothetical protein [Phaeodactylibacter sp.]MCB9038460.1 hypothetical protein [Lewinellaceae bacterium]